MRQLDAGGIERRAGRGYVGTGLQQCGLCVVVVLRADHAGLREPRIALGAQPRDFDGRLRAFQVGLCHPVVGAVGRVVQLVQRLAGLDLAALAEQPLLDDPGYLWTDVGDQPGAGTARQVAGKRHGLRGQRDDGDRHGLVAGRRAALGAPAAGDCDGKQHEKQGSADVQVHGMPRLPRPGGRRRVAGTLAGWKLECESLTRSGSMSMRRVAADPACG